MIRRVPPARRAWMPGYKLRGNPVRGQLPGGAPLRVHQPDNDPGVPVHALWGQF